MLCVQACGCVEDCINTVGYKWLPGTTIRYQRYAVGSLGVRLIGLKMALTHGSWSWWAQGWGLGYRAASEVLGLGWAHCMMGYDTH